MSLEIRFKYPNEITVSYKIKGNDIYRMSQECLAEDGKTTLADLFWDTRIIKSTANYCSQLRECLENLQEEPKRFITIGKSKKAYTRLVEFLKMVLSAYSTMHIDTEIFFIC